MALALIALLTKLECVKSEANFCLIDVLQYNKSTECDHRSQYPLGGMGGGNREMSQNHTWEGDQKLAKKVLRII